ncbi:MAG TPA: hypothetical protein VLA16_18855 [Ideonella sp.]|nr:hypothetical protein [Ideonella sp.]
MLPAIAPGTAPQAALHPAPPPATADSQATALLRFNRRLLDQALALVAAHERPGAASFEAVIGPHLRHVIEHYEALVMPPAGVVVDYDKRPRDRSVERLPQVARTRLQALQARLAGWPDAMLQKPTRVRTQGGLAGELEFVTPSTIGRELVFLASHAVHHFALLKTHCAAHGIATDAHFGQAPSTVAHQLQG